MALCNAMQSSQSPACKTAAAAALAELTQHDHTRPQVARWALPALAHLMADASNIAAQSNAAEALAELAAIPDLRRTIADLCLSSLLNMLVRAPAWTLLQ